MATALFLAFIFLYYFESIQGLGIFFLGLVDPIWNRLLSPAYQKKPGFSILHAWVCNIKKIKVGNNAVAIICFYVN